MFKWTGERARRGQGGARRGKERTVAITSYGSTFCTPLFSPSFVVLCAVRSKVVLTFTNADILCVVCCFYIILSSGIKVKWYAAL